ncbi:MAG: NAD(P)/FAD-dependent oxidoreductase [Asgard group archaeon]|nr:NAD(P)/FAD-dependent oxidoreductase [Asgard group archaeon]
MIRKKVVVIGAGIAGLSTGIYLQMSGYDSEIYELHDISGGLCTAWERKGYTFDGCIHWLTGSGPASELYDIWVELGAINKETQIIDSEIYVRLENREGNQFSIYTNVDKLEAEMIRLSSKDEEVIKEFTDAIRFFVQFGCSRDNPPPPEIQMTFREKVPEFFRKWGAMPINDYVNRIQGSVLRNFMFMLYGDFMGNDSSIFMLIAMLGYMHAKSAGYPIGGSLEFAKRIEQRYLDLGGKIHFKKRVKEIIVENNKAVGIKLKKDKEIPADIVISAADGYDTIFNMLKGKYIDNEIKGYYKNLEPFPPICQVSFGVADEFIGEPHYIQFPLNKPITIDPKTEMKDISIKFYNFDPTLAPKGKTAVVSFFIAKDYEYWVNLRENDRKKYDETKEKIADEILDQLETRFPNIKSKVEVIDIATPATFIRYTNNWQGSYEGWLPNIQLSGKAITETLPGLDNFFMVGHWTRPGGGLPPAAMSAKKIVEIICKEDGKEFTTK